MTNKQRCIRRISCTTTALKHKVTNKKSLRWSLFECLFVFTMSGDGKSGTIVGIGRSIGDLELKK